MLVVSSGEVYGVGSGVARRETDPLQPVSAYAASKVGAEVAALEAWRRAGLRVVIARPFGHTGPGQTPDYVRAVVGGAAQGGASVRRGPGGGRQPDAGAGSARRARRGDGLSPAAGRRAWPGEAYNVARGEGLALADVFARLADADRRGVASPCPTRHSCAAPIFPTWWGIPLSFGAPRAGRRRSHSTRRSRDWLMPKRTDLKTILLIGSGPIVIGQGAEFDYSGTQAVRALKEEGYRVVLVNSNPATIMTDPELADRTYIEPVTPEWVAKVIERERPDALLPTMGGQTALNVAMALQRDGTLENVRRRADRRQRARHPARGGPGGVRPGDAPDRAGHAARAARCGASTRRSRRSRRPGIPAILRPSFTLGGTGGGIAYNLRGVRDPDPARARALAGGLGAGRAQHHRLEGVRARGDARRRRQRRHRLLDREPRPDGRPHRRLDHRRARP